MFPVFWTRIEAGLMLNDITFELKKHFSDGRNNFGIEMDENTFFSLITSLSIGSLRKKNGILSTEKS